MKKLLLLAAAAMAFAVVPASATPGNGCAAGPGALDAASSCTYTAAGLTARYTTLTPNGWSITTIRDGEFTVLAEGETAPPASGLIDTLPGEVITVTMGPDCVPMTPVCGSVGTVAVVETA